MNEYQAREQVRRSRDIDRLLELISTGLPLTVTIKTRVTLAELRTPADDLPPKGSVERVTLTERQRAIMLRGKEVADELFPETKDVIPGSSKEDWDSLERELQDKCGPAREQSVPTPANAKIQKTMKPAVEGKRRGYLTADMVRSVRRMLEAGMTHGHIATTLGVSKGTVSRIKHGRSYGYVEDHPTQENDNE